MLTEKAVEKYLEYHKVHSRPNTLRVFEFTLSKFSDLFEGIDISKINENDIIEFINIVASHTSLSTKNIRLSCVNALFNFTCDTTMPDLLNPCRRAIVKKLFKQPATNSPTLIDKDLINEIIFRTIDERDRLILELMGRTGMRIGEVLNITPADLDTNASSLHIQEPKSGRVGEKVYLTKKITNRLYEYICKNTIHTNNKIFPISYSTAYRMVQNAGKLVNVNLKPHDLRRHAATQASRNGTPLEIVSKVILRHADISTTQRYLGSVDPDEARRWMEQLYR